ncbi:MAG: family 65 glycosyl hydrolase [Spirochaetaceae bacterium 4572_59]|nr:MAG: family 65 glycosyl hydrolase [Spirochaetaceae bacterium 4572_59]
MKEYLKKDPWHIIEEGFHPEYNRISESVFSIGNGYMGQRANFEESYTGDSLQGSYMAGVYYPDKTIVGWWKNGYPEYFAKVLNSTKWIGLEIRINGEVLDLAKVNIVDFKRDLDMRNGLLCRSFHIKMPSGADIHVEASRFMSLSRPENAVMAYKLMCSDRNIELQISSTLDGNVTNQDANYQEMFWDHHMEEISSDTMTVSMTTRKTAFTNMVKASHKLSINDKKVKISPETETAAGFCRQSYSIDLECASSFKLEKYISAVSSRDYEKENLAEEASKKLQAALRVGYDGLFAEHSSAWHDKWELSDLTIKGDVSAQQGIRFNIFQMLQTYTGRDERLNIGPKGFTGEKYGGSTYWDTEAYCIPFYLGCSDPSIARNLLIYRYKHLEKAIENAEKLGFTGGAALYPMVTMNGEECHNEWEITFEEIHRNGAIAYAIWNYINSTGDDNYLREYGLEVLIAIGRFWAQRSTFSKHKKKYVILGVTGPNEYENNVNNNWYTNTMAAWCMNYAIEAVNLVQSDFPTDYERIVKKTAFSLDELKDFEERSRNMHFPEDEASGVFLQQDGYLDKEDLTTDDLSDKDRPLNQNWSWDRILRSCFIKQADVLQGLFFFEDRYDRETLKKNFDYYEPKTVHESSLSSCVHSILASRIGYEKKAYEMYLRTARLDLDDYNNDTDDGCHITSMAGTWMAIVMGFGGLKYQHTEIQLNPTLPSAWQSYAFHIIHKDSVLGIEVLRDKVCVSNKGKNSIKIKIYNTEISIEPGTVEELSS